ncbi:hypothetical protein GGS20DRAFT_583410 [Poronia punctata]|nr:hypothetical protein GGS20DRAFT_583410 [Poronia punctata]
MRFSITFALGLALSSTAVVGSPVATITPAPETTPTTTANSEAIITSTGGTAIGGALNLAAHPTNNEFMAKPPPDGLAITIVNHHYAPVSTTHNRNAKAPVATSGHFAPGTIGVGQSAVFAVPTNWGGRVGVAAAHEGPLTDGRDVSLIEASFMYSPDVGFAVADVDISYV